MAIFRNFTGFEAGDASGLSAGSGPFSIIADGTARSGGYHAKVLKVNQANGYRLLPIVGIASSAGGGVRAHARIFFRLNQYPNFDAFTSVLGFGSGNFGMHLDMSGHFRAVLIASVGAWSTAVLSLGVWYELIIEADLIHPVTGSNSGTTTITITGLEAVTVTNPTVGSGVYTLTNALIGAFGATNYSVEMHYDDVVIVAASDADRSSVVLPTATKIVPVRITGQGASDGWTPAGAWERLDEIPFNPGAGAGDEITAAAVVDTTYTHSTLATIGTIAAYAWKVYANVKGSGAQAVLLDGVEYAHTPPAGYLVGSGTGVALDWTARDAASFDGVAFGYRDKTGAALTMGGITSEALVSDTAPETDFTLLPAQSGETIGLSWIEWTHVDEAGAAKTYVWSPIYLPDPTTYYGGEKDARILSFGAFSRALSDARGQYEAASFSWVASDVDRLIRGLADGRLTKHFQNRMVALRMISDADRRLLKRPRLVARGVIRQYRPTAPLTFEFLAEDFLASRFSFANLEKQIPARTIDVVDFPNAPEAALGLGVPIIYGTLDDSTAPVPGLTKPVVTPSVIGAGGSTTRHYVVTALDNRAGQRNSYALRANHAGETDGDLVVVTGAPDDSQQSASNYVHLAWPAVPGAVFYRVYGRYPNAVAFLDEADPSETYDDGGDHDRIKTDSVPPSANQTTVPDAGWGVVPTIYVGPRDIGGTVWHEFLVCGHAIASLVGWYQNQIAVQTEGTDWLVPGRAQWIATIGAASYRDVNGRRYTVLYGRNAPGDAAADGSLPLTVNVHGVEDVGDGSGVLIDQLADIYQHFVVNWGFQSYASGVWLTPPAWPLDLDALALSQVDEASFDAVRAIHLRRLVEGYPGGIGFGLNETAITLRDAIARLNLSCDCDCGFNRHSQFFISAFDDAIALLTTARPYAQDRHIIVVDSFESDVDVDGLENVVVYSYARRYASATWDVEDAEIADADSMAGYQETKRSRARELYGVRHATVASDVAQRYLLRHKDPPIRVRFRTDLGGLSTELGDVVTYTHLGGIGAAGAVARPLRILRHLTEPETFSVELEGADAQRLFDGAYILGDETALVDWTVETAAGQRYGHLCDEATALFSDSDPGKRLR